MEDRSAPVVLCIFEDSRYPNFFPLSLNKPVFELICGTQSLRERIVAEVNPERTVLVCRKYLADVLSGDLSLDPGMEGVLVNELPESDILFVNGRLLAFGDEFGGMMKGIGINSVIEKNGTPVAALLPAGKASKFLEFIMESLDDADVARVFSVLKEISSQYDE